MTSPANQRQFLASKLDALTETEVGEVLDYISVIESDRRALRAGSAPFQEDEVVMALADAPENRRARQAFEWEAVRRKAEKRAAAKVGGYYS